MRIISLLHKKFPVNNTMEDQRRILLAAVDESKESIFALQWFLSNLTPKNDYTLVLLYVRPQPPVYSMYGSGYLFLDEEITAVDKYYKDLSDSILNKAKNICRSYSNIEVEVKACTGDARDVICDMVQKLRAEVLVMGSHGYGFIKRVLLGSVSDYCAKNAKCPVVVVKHSTG